MGLNAECHGYCIRLFNINAKGEETGKNGEGTGQRDSKSRANGHGENTLKGGERLRDRTDRIPKS